jgi:hypothetical protein
LLQLFAFSLTIATDANAVTSTSADANPTAHKIDRQFRQPVEFIVGETVRDFHTNRDSALGFRVSSESKD